MASVSHFLVFALVSLAASLCGSDAGHVEPAGIMASVREYPMNIHRCTGTFLTPKFILTTGACVLCQKKCDFFVQLIFHDVMESNGENVYEVKYYAYHPNYEREPEKYDVGMVELYNDVPHAPVHTLPDPDEWLFNIDATFYSWRLTGDKKDFKFVANKGLTVPNDMCYYVYIYDYVPDEILCAHLDTTISLGPYDYGTPLLGYSNESVVLGTFTDRNPVHYSSTIMFQSIIPFLPWIKSFIAAH